jgi:hypothetical protein
MNYVIDIVGTCNLRCPSCPVGNFEQSDFDGIERKKGFMELDLFRSILGKINADNPGVRPHLLLYNWGEALMHPRVGNFLEAISEANLTVDLSTNLNGEIDLRSLVRASSKQIRSLRISLSGFSQAVYEKSHKRGEMALVKSNMYKLRHYMDLYKKDIYTYVYYHVYRDNLEGEVSDMGKLCQDLGYGLRAGWAQLMPLEKVMTALDVPFLHTINKLPGSIKKNQVIKEDFTERKQLSAEDKKVVSRLVIPINVMADMAMEHTITDCPLRRQQTVINFDGSVPLCCGVYDPAFTVAGSFLNYSKAELQAKKYQHELCAVCFDYDIPQIMITHPPELWDEKGNSILRELGVKTEIQVVKGLIKVWN